MDGQSAGPTWWDEEVKITNHYIAVVNSPMFSNNGSESGGIALCGEDPYFDVLLRSLQHPIR